MNKSDIIYIFALMGSVALLPSCVRSTTPETTADGRVLEQRIAKMEGIGNQNAPRATPEELRKQYQADLAEIQHLGLVDRAQQDFNTRLKNTTITKWSIGFFMDTNTVWCDVRYTVRGSEEIFQKEFGYTRRVGTKVGSIWNLLWSK